MLKTYKKTATIDAIEWDGRNHLGIIKWAASFGVEITVGYQTNNPDATFETKLRIPTLEGPMYGSIGDFIAKGIKDEFWAIKPDVMAATYQVVSVHCRCSAPTDWCPDCAD